MAFQSTFTPIELGDLLNLTRAKHDAGYRFAQMLCAMADEGIDLVYSFIKQDDEGTWQLENYVIGGYDPATQTVPSVTGYFLSAFPFENEAHDLFGVKVEGNKIDFAGRFYQVAMDTPMAVISPEQKAAREKAARIAAAKAAKEAKAKAAAAGEGAVPAPAAAEAPAPAAQPAPKPIDPESERAAFEAKIAGLDPEKAERMRAAFEVKLKKRMEEAAQAVAQASAEPAASEPAAAASAPSPADDIEAKRAQMEERIKDMDPEKAAKVRAAFEAKVARDAAQKGGE